MTMTEAIRELSSIGVIITWSDRDENEPRKPTRQLMLADFCMGEKIGVC